MSLAKKGQNDTQATTRTPHASSHISQASHRVAKHDSSSRLVKAMSGVFGIEHGPTVSEVRDRAQMPLQMNIICMNEIKMVRLRLCFDVFVFDILFCVLCGVCGACAAWSYGRMLWPLSTLLPLMMYRIIHLTL